MDDPSYAWIVAKFQISDVMCIIIVIVFDGNSKHKSMILLITYFLTITWDSSAITNLCCSILFPNYLVHMQVKPKWIG